MSSFRIWIAALLLRTYAAIALVVAAVFSPAALSIAPILLLVWHVYLWWRPVNPALRLLSDFFLFFAIALSLTTELGSFAAVLISLPMLALVTIDLQEAAARPMYQASRFRRSPTRVGVALPLVTVAALGLSWLLSSLTLLCTSTIAMVCFVVLFAIVLRRLPSKPVEEEQVEQRVVAGSQSEVDVKLTGRTADGMMALQSPYPWVTVSPTLMPLKAGEMTVRVNLTPDLSGPSLIRINGQATDCWGLTRVSFDVEPIRLRVVPRAKYAVWLADKYLAEGRPGGMPLMSSVARLNPQHGLRRGVEYYGSRPYQPGDSMRSIDWKHSAVRNEIIVKQFAEFEGRSAVVLANLAVASAEEADQIAYKVIVTALTLAGGGIRAALAAYDDKGVRLTTALLDPRQLILRSLQLAMETVTVPDPQRYLSPPDVGRLRANMSRVRSGKSEASRVLAELLGIEYRNLEAHARRHPATIALQSALSKVDNRSNIVVISGRNHDAEALAFNAFNYARKGNSVITV